MSGLQWGVMGTGGIAASMVDALHQHGADVTAVGSSRPGAAAEFAAATGIAHAVDSHDAVAASDLVDVVYVATTNDRHHDNVLACVAAGKPALCEKPIALNTSQARSMFAAAETSGVFLMEAMWMRFMPFLATVDKLIADGSIGELRHVQASFSYSATQDPARRWMNPALGGGSLLDLGIYPISLVHHLLGPPDRFQASGTLTGTGVDAAVTMVSEHAGAATAMVGSSFTYDMTTEAILSGTEARLRVAAPFYHSPLVTLERRGEIISRHDTSYEGHGFLFEIAEVERCIDSGITQSPQRPHHATLEVMEWMDAIRREIGVAYPGERA